MNIKRCALLAVLVACDKEEAGPPQLLDTGWFDTATTGLQDCEHQIVDYTPEDGATGVYWRDRPMIYTQTDVQHAYNVWLETTDGERVPTQMVPQENGVSFALEWDGYLQASTDYVMGLQDCAQTRYVTFRTSPLGTPLAIEPMELTGRTFLLDLVGAQWVEPPQLAGIMQTFFTTPVLMGVRFADETRIDLIGAPGITDDLGRVRQDSSQPTWDFPMTDFTSAPYLETQVDHIVLKYEDTEIPVEDFLLQITFDPDGRTLGGGVLSGLGDTRHLHELVGSNDPNFLCEQAAGLGLQCEACADGEPYCMHLSARNIDGSLVNELVLIEHD